MVRGSFVSFLWDRAGCRRCKYDTPPFFSWRMAHTCFFCTAVSQLSAVHVCMDTNFFLLSPRLEERYVPSVGFLSSSHSQTLFYGCTVYVFELLFFVESFFLLLSLVISRMPDCLMLQIADIIPEEVTERRRREWRGRRWQRWEREVCRGWWRRTRRRRRWK